MLKDPDKPNGYLVRRLAAIEGYEMVSTDEKDTPFILEKDQCWVLSDNESLKPKVLLLVLCVTNHIQLHVVIKIMSRAILLRLLNVIMFAFGRYQNLECMSNKPYFIPLILQHAQVHCFSFGEHKFLWS